MVPKPGERIAAAWVRQAEAAAAAAETACNAALFRLRSPVPVQVIILTNQMLNTLNGLVEDSCRELDEAGGHPARIRLGDLTPEMMRLDAQAKHFTPRHQMAAYNTQTTSPATSTATTPATATRPTL